MAFIVLKSNETNLSKVVFKPMALETAQVIAAHMNKLSEMAAKRTGQTVKLVYKVMGK